MSNEFLSSFWRYSGKLWVISVYAWVKWYFDCYIYDIYDIYVVVNISIELWNVDENVEISTSC